MEAAALKSVYSSRAIYIPYQFSHTSLTHKDIHTYCRSRLCGQCQPCLRHDYRAAHIRLSRIRSSADALDNYRIGYNNALMCLVIQWTPVAC